MSPSIKLSRPIQATWSSSPRAYRMNQRFWLTRTGTQAAIQPARSSCDPELISEVVLGARAHIEETSVLQLPGVVLPLFEAMSRQHQGRHKSDVRSRPGLTHLSARPMCRVPAYAHECRPQGVALASHLWSVRPARRRILCAAPDSSSKAASGLLASPKASRLPPSSRGRTFGLTVCPARAQLWPRLATTPSL